MLEAARELPDEVQLLSDVRLEEELERLVEALVEAHSQVRSSLLEKQLDVVGEPTRFVKHARQLADGGVPDASKTAQDLILPGSEPRLFVLQQVVPEHFLTKNFK